MGDREDEDRIDAVVSRSIASASVLFLDGIYFVMPVAVQGCFDCCIIEKAVVGVVPFVEDVQIVERKNDRLYDGCEPGWGVARTVSKPHSGAFCRGRLLARRRSISSLMSRISDRT
jgi:hypothetical protein